MLRLDETLKSFLTGDDGKPVLDPDKNAIPTAVDLLSGKTFQKVVESISDSDPKALGAKQESLAESGAEHYSSEDSHFRGYWKPVVATPPAGSSQGPGFYDRFRA